MNESNKLTEFTNWGTLVQVLFGKTTPAPHPECLTTRYSTAVLFKFCTQPDLLNI